MVGPGYGDEHDVRLHQQKGILPSHDNITIIGNGYDSVLKKDWELLKGNIDGNTAFHIMAHGGWDDKTGSHLILLHKERIYKTENILKELQSLNENIPMNIFLWSCFSGKAFQVVNSLAVGSTLIMQANTEMPVDLAIRNAKQIIHSSLSHESSQIKHPIIDVITYAPTLIVEKLTLAVKTLLGVQVHNIFPKIEGMYGDVVIELNRQVQGLVEFVKETSIASDIDSSYNLSHNTIREFLNNQVTWYSYVGNFEKVGILLDNILKVNCKAYGCTLPFHTAISQGHEKIVKLYLDKDASINEVGEEGKGVLYAASQTCQDKIVNLLLERGAFIDIAAEDGMTSLILAVQKGCEEVVKSLLKQGANPNLARNDGCTPLIMAAQKGNENIVKSLLIYGADPTLQTKRTHVFGKDWYVHERAYDCKHYEVAQLLEYAKNKYLAKCYGDDNQVGIELVGNYLEGIEYI